MDMYLAMVSPKAALKQLCLCLSRCRCSSLPWLFNALGLGWAALSMQEEWRIATAACTRMGKVLKAIRHVLLPLLYVLD
jgi:hypothetical protein